MAHAAAADVSEELNMKAMLLTAAALLLPAPHQADPPPALYPSVSLDKIASGKWVRPRAKITGAVTLVRVEDDGDVHIRLAEGSKFLVLEIIPELKIRPPKVGDTITAWGVVRWDGEHRWAELHPLVGWK
jgi:hypothetical protein